MTPRPSRARWAAPMAIGAAVLAISNLPLLIRSLPAGVGPLPSWVTSNGSTTVMAVGNAVAILLLVAGLIRLVSVPSRTSALARSLERQGDMEGAGEALLKGGHPRRAIRYFERARAWVPAARAALQADRPEKAAELFQKAGGTHLEEAARLYRRLGRRDDARECDGELARWFALRDRMADSIEAWLRAGEPLKAVRAAHLAIDAHQLKPSLRSFDAARKAAESTRSLDLMGLLAELAEDWPRAAAIWRQLKEHEKAGRCYRLAGRLEDAAEEEEAAGRLSEATRLRLHLLRRLRMKVPARPPSSHDSGEWRRGLEEKIGKLENQVLPALEQLGMEDDLVAELAASGRTDEVIRRLTQNGDLDRAAEIAAQNARTDLAAELSEQAGRWGEASDLWEIAGDFSKAAQCAERAGEDERALMLYKSSGDVLGQARCLARSRRLQEGLGVLHAAGMWDESFRLLQEVPGPLPDIPEIVQDLAQALHDEGRHHEAIAVLQRAVMGVALTAKRLGPPVMLASLLHEEGEHEAALEQLARVLDFDYSHQPAHILRQQILQISPALRRTVDELEELREENTAETRYEILEEVGRGGMGVVYRARDTRLEREVAIKVLRTTRQEEILRLEREAKAAATLNHPGIVTIYDFEQGFGGYFIVMEFADGEALDQLLRTRADSLRNSLRQIMIHVADAVAFAHSRNVIHRDLKPGNLMLTRDDQIKILDFGIAARLDAQLTPSEQVCGTPYYMAPEQIRGDAPSPASDVYSLGATFFHLATGRPPFVKGNIIQGHLSEAPPDPRSLNPQLDQSISRIILSCLSKEPGQRFPSAAELRDELARTPR